MVNLLCFEKFGFDARASNLIYAGSRDLHSRRMMNFEEKKKTSRHRLTRGSQIG
jgi:hypothetical protein